MLGQDVVVALIIQGARVLVELRSEQNEHSPGAFRFPAGHVEPGETLEAALEREVLEELGVGIRSRQKVREADFSGADGKPRRLHYFSVELAGPAPEGGAWRWFEKKDGTKMSFPADRQLIQELL